jgi:hypothetical protein
VASRARGRRRLAASSAGAVAAGAAPVPGGSAPAHPPAAPVALPDDAWGRAIAAVRPDVPPALFAAYLAPTALESVASDGGVVVRAADDFAAEKVARTWGGELLAALRAELGSEATLRIHRFHVGDGPPPPLG